MQGSQRWFSNIRQDSPCLQLRATSAYRRRSLAKVGVHGRLGHIRDWDGYRDDTSGSALTLKGGGRKRVPSFGMVSVREISMCIREICERLRRRDQVVWRQHLDSQGIAQ